MSVIEVGYSKITNDYDIRCIPAICFDLIINTLWNDPRTRWLSEELMDEQAVALAARDEDY